MKTIFLDIDGVLHPENAADVCVREDGRLGFLGDKLFAWNSVLEHLVFGKSVQIVIHSTWRHYYRLHELRNFFPETIRQQVVAVTDGAARFDSIQRFLEKHQDVANFGYVVVDDMADTFPEDWPFLIACDGTKGISCGTVQAHIADFIQGGPTDFELCREVETPTRQR